MILHGQPQARAQRTPSGAAKAILGLLSLTKRWPGLDRAMRQLWRYLPDKLFVSMQYLETYGRFPDLKNPRTFDEKLQCYKLYYRNPLMAVYSDKYKVREYVASQGFGGILNELIGVYATADAINPATLPNSFVLKATHGSAMNIICKDKARLNWIETRAQLTQWLQMDYSRLGREWAYANIPPRLICEKYLENSEQHELIDYKFYCFSGQPELMFVCTGRYNPEGVRYNAYDMQWNLLPLRKGRESSRLTIEKPDTWGQMVEIARALSQGFPFMRVDLYSIEGKVYFGELTFYPDNGKCPFTPDEYNYIYGDLLVLPPQAKGRG